VKNAQHTQVASVIVRRAGQILLVEQQGPNDPTPYWALPGGVVEHGELAPEAAIRELVEESGLHGGQLRGIAYSVFGVDRETGDSFSVIVFTVEEVEGLINVDDPDGVVKNAQFVDEDAAMRRLQALPYPMMREPLVDYLSGVEEPSAAWFYSHQQFAEVSRVSVFSVGWHDHERPL